MTPIEIENKYIYIYTYIYIYVGRSKLLILLQLKMDVIGFELDLLVLQGLCTNLPLFTKLVFACFDRGSYIHKSTKTLC